MVEIRPDEVSAIIREQLSNFKSATELEEVGTVLQVGDGIARIYGLTKVQSGELIQFANGVEGIVLNLEEDNVGAVLLGTSEEIKEGEILKNRINIVSMIEPYVGKYVSNEWVRKNVLRQTDDDIGEITEQIIQEQSNPLYYPPAPPMPEPQQ